ncbi:uncharacterized protein LOC130808201 [Amaranthus tricolor]|uniref:uncharacterized protein LOC130808201 n=1 Tax=Amaranthus tricolor TaxID=29722 RepID=UPI0025910AD7|nr:uncharacterized protein LOC130808201 [Amaranthus tricolor]
MVHLATEFSICASLIIVVCTLVCLAECGKCPQDGVRKPFSYGAFHSVRVDYNGLQNSYSSHLSSDYESRHEKADPFNNNAPLTSELVHFPSVFYGFQSEEQCSSAGNLNLHRSDLGGALPKQLVELDGNVSWSSDDFLFGLPDEQTVTCSLNFRKFDDEDLSPSVNIAQQVFLSSCRGHLSSIKETSFSYQNIVMHMAPSSDSSSPCLDIRPGKLNWELNYLYHSSVASLRLEYTCNESVLMVYDLFSTDSQFYPLNFGEIVLDPGEVTTLFIAYLPNRLGLSSAQLVLQTSVGGFLIEAKGFSVESPHRLSPLLGLDSASDGWLSRDLSLSNPYDEVIVLEEVSALISIFASSVSLAIESICRKQKPNDSNKHGFSNVDRKLSEIMNVAVRPLGSWLISPQKTQKIFEMTFSPDSNDKVNGKICMELFRESDGKKDILVIPFEAEHNKSAIWKGTTSRLSVYLDTVGSCEARETTISVSIRNRASDLVKIVKIDEITDGEKLLQIKYLEGLLLFPGTITQSALVTYETSNVKCKSFVEMPDVSKNCRLELLVNDSINPLLEIPCRDIFGICPSHKRESVARTLDIVDPSNGTGCMTSTEQSLTVTKALGGVEADDFVHEGRKALSTKSGLYLLHNHELLFPLVPIGNYYAKSVIVRNPSQQPVIVQLILHSGEDIDNCETYYGGHQQSFSPSSSCCTDTTRVGRYGFSLADITVTEAFLHPHGTASLGPILFHPSNRCEWKSSAFIRSNLSGIELLSLRGFGGSLSLVILEGSVPMQRLNFNMNLPFPLNTSYIEDLSSWCRKPLLKKLVAVNTGDFHLKIERIDISGKECGSDGFIVHNCGGFSLEPGESMELELSYQSDFSTPLLQRELELILAFGILIIPMRATLPVHMLNLCRNSIFWSQVKGYSLAFVLPVLIICLLFWFIMLSGSMNNESCQKNEEAIIPCKSGHIEPGIISEHTDQSVDWCNEISPSSNGVKKSDFSPGFPLKSDSVDSSAKCEAAEQPVHLTVKTRKEKKRRSRRKNTLFEVSSSQSGNSTPTSPLSPITTLSPPEICSPSRDKLQPNDSFSPETVASTTVPENQNRESNVTSRIAGSRAMLSPSATFPGTRNAPSRLAISLLARAPGPRIDSPKAVQPEKNSRAEDDRFTYDIWGNHFSGVHLCMPNSSYNISSGNVSYSSSFFIRNPRETLMENSQPPYVSNFGDDG